MFNVCVLGNDNIPRPKIKVVINSNFCDKNRSSKNWNQSEPVSVLFVWLLIIDNFSHFIFALIPVKTEDLFGEREVKRFFHDLI